jgi:hypothetical protein
MAKCRIEDAAFVNICVFQFVTICGYRQIQSDPKQIQNKTNGPGLPGHGLVMVYTSFIQALPMLWMGWAGAKLVWLLAISC